MPSSRQELKYRNSLANGKMTTIAFAGMDERWIQSTELCRIVTSFMHAFSEIQRPAVLPESCPTFLVALSSSHLFFFSYDCFSDQNGSCPITGGWSPVAHPRDFWDLVWLFPEPPQQLLLYLRPGQINVSFIYPSTTGLGIHTALTIFTVPFS